MLYSENLYSDSHANPVVQVQAAVYLITCNNELTKPDVFITNGLCGYFPKGGSYQEQT